MGVKCILKNFLEEICDKKGISMKKFLLQIHSTTSSFVKWATGFFLFIFEINFILIKKREKMATLNKDLKDLFTNIFQADDEFLIKIDDKMLESLGYKGESFKCKKYEFTEFLTTHPFIKYEEIVVDEETLYQLKSRQFEMLIMNLNTKMATKLQDLYFKCRSDVKIRIQREMECDFEDQNSEMDIRVCPKPINSKKIHFFGLYYHQKNTEWYFMRRQKENWNLAERILLKKGFNKLAMWENVSMGIYVGNYLKKYLNEQFSFISAHHNTISLRENAEYMDTENFPQIIEEYLDELISSDGYSKKVEGTNYKTND